MTTFNNNTMSHEKRIVLGPVIHTDLYRLIDAVISSTRPGENNLTCFIVSHILESRNIHLSKGLKESIEGNDSH